MSPATSHTSKTTFSALKTCKIRPYQNNQEHKRKSYCGGDVLGQTRVLCRDAWAVGADCREGRGEGRGAAGSLAGLLQSPPFLLLITDSYQLCINACFSEKVCEKVWG